MLLVALAVVPRAAFADEGKLAEPVATHLVQENSDGAWYPAADWPQGTQFPFRVTGTLPSNISTQASYEYWLVAKPEPCLVYIDGTAQVRLVHANGSSQDVTASLSVSVQGGSIVAGATNIVAAVGPLAATDTFELYYTCTYASDHNLGFLVGNPSYAHIEFTPASNTVHAEAASEAKPAEQTDPRSANLKSSPSVKATVYCYAVEVLKVAQATEEPLAGARFALRDADGLWYVQGEPWSQKQAEATVLTSDSQGKLRFEGLDSAFYELVEVAAPSGYASVGSVDVTLESGVTQGELVLSASSQKATVRLADATTGVVGLRVEDPTSLGSGAQGAFSSTRAAGRVPTTGDATQWAGAAAIGLAGLVLLLVAARRRASQI